jgi:N-acetylmuramoyl-L-alanine amidase
MKYSYLSLTFLIAFLPAFIPTFNSFDVGGKNETLSTTLIDTLNHGNHSHHFNCPFESHCNANQIHFEQHEFGSAMGQFIRETRITDPDYKIKKVVIDPGHGGKDPGCSGATGTKEKEIALSIALQVGRTLESYFPSVQFIFTRETDVFVPLDRRAEIANENNADLFISIHCNNFPKSSKPKGSETYVLGLHRADDNLEVAKRENAAIFYEDNYQATYDGYDPNSAEGHIILSMFQNAFLEQSISFANKIEKNITQKTQHRSRGVRQAGFLVLRETTMPSVLIETGYLSNPWDNQFLSTINGQAQVVNAITQAFVEYKNEVEGGYTPAIPDNYASTITQPDRAKQVSLAPVPVQQPKMLKPSVYPTKQIAKSGDNNTALAKQSLIIPSKNNSSNPAPTPIVNTNEVVQYKVLLASSNKLVDTDSGAWKNIPYTVQVIRDGNSFKYMAIGFENFEKAVTAKSELRNIGFKEAFLVAYENGKRIDMKVAMSKTGVK